MLKQRFALNKWYSSTLQELFVETCKRRADKPALVFNGTDLAFGQVLENVNKLSQALLTLGVKRGDHIAMLPTASPEFAYVYFAALQIGALINPLNLLWGNIELAGILPRNDPKIIFTIDKNGGRDYIQMLREAIPDLEIKQQSVSAASIPTLSHLVRISRTDEEYEGFLNFEEVLESGSNYDSSALEALVREARCTDVQYMCQTSGSTGLSKSALWNHRPPLATANFAAKHLFISEDDSYINLTPFYHNSGMCALNIAFGIAGITLYLIEN